jgi:hypothetical protein
VVVSPHDTTISHAREDRPPDARTLAKLLAAAR